MEDKYLAEKLYDLCTCTASTPCLAEGDWQRFKIDHHMEPSQCEAMLVLTIRRLCGRATDLQVEVDRLRELHRPTTAQDIRDAILKERARTASTLDIVISDIVGQFGDVPFDIVQRGIGLARRGDLNRQREFEENYPF